MLVIPVRHVHLGVRAQVVRRHLYVAVRPVRAVLILQGTAERIISVHKTNPVSVINHAALNVLVMQQAVVLLMRLVRTIRGTHILVRSITAVRAVPRQVHVH